MTTTLTKATLAEMLRRSVAKIEENLDELTRLDSETGDGDHGTSMLRAIKAAAEAATQDGSLKETLHAIGWAVMSQDCGSTGPLLGSIFMGMSQGAAGDQLDAAQTKAMFEGGLAGIQKHSKAQVGDKTMMDALIPAVEAMDAQADIASMMTSAAHAAAAGAEATTQMVAKFGRARNLGERTLGYKDAGATSMALLFAAFAEAVK